MYVEDLNMSYKGFNGGYYSVSNYLCTECGSKMSIANKLALFSGGSGTKLEPFKISNATDFGMFRELSNEYEQFTYRISEGYTITAPDMYFELTADIDISGIESINSFMGHLDGKGHKLIKNNLSNESTQTEVFVSVYGHSSFSNIEFQSHNVVLTAFFGWNNEIALPNTDSDGSISFDNVNIVKGSYLEDGTNLGYYLSSSNGKTVSFNNCTNNGDTLTSAYGSAFMGGYGIKSHITFNSCVLTGSVKGINAGMLVGNANRMAENTYVVTNCINKGTIYGAQTAGLFSSMNLSQQIVKDNAALYDGVVGKIVNEGTGSYGVAGITFTSKDNVDKTIAISSTSDLSKVAKYVLDVKFYSWFRNNTNGSQGTFLKTIYTETFEGASLDLATILPIRAMVKDYSSDYNVNEGSIYNDNGVSYYVYKSYTENNIEYSFSNSAVTEIKPIMTFTAYDASGNMLGSKNL